MRPELAVLYRVARRICDCPEDAEDAVGQTLMKAAKAWASFDGVFLRSWLIRILRNEVLNKRREDRARPATVAIDEEMIEAKSFWDDVHWKLASERIVQELDELPQEYPHAVQQCDVEHGRRRRTAKSRPRDEEFTSARDRR